MLILSHEQQKQVEHLCRKYGVRRLDLFGSATRPDFKPGESDIDLAVEFDRLQVADASDRYLGLLVDLEDLFQREVDLVTSSSIRNPFFRTELERTRRPLYAAA